MPAKKKAKRKRAPKLPVERLPVPKKASRPITDEKREAARTACRVPAKKMKDDAES